MVKIENHHLKYWDANNLYGLAMSQKLPVNKSEWIEEMSCFNAEFLKSYNEESDEEYFLEVDVQCPEKLRELHNCLPFLPERKKIKKAETLVTNLYDKNN